MTNKYSLGLDFGSNSLGWAILELDNNNNPSHILKLGSYIYTDGREAKTHSSKASARTSARGIRNNIDRRIGRRNHLMNLLIEYGLFSRDINIRLQYKNLNPYLCRAKAVKEKVSKEELGRALYHICLRRGFKSNRKDSSDKDMKKLKERVVESAKILDQSDQTLGELLYERLQNNKPTRLIEGNNLYYLRKFYEDEFSKIRSVQKEFHTLTSEQWDNLRTAIFWQRDLKSQEKGLCEFMYAQGERRIAKASPFFQTFRILSDINNIKIHKHGTERRALTPDEKASLNTLLNKQKEIKFSAINKKIGLDKDFEFNLHTEKRDKLKGNTTSILMSKPEYFGDRWHKLSIDEQDAIIDTLVDDKNTSDFIYQKAVKDWGLAEESAQNISQNISSESFEKGYGNLCKKLIKKILPHMHDGKGYDKALAVEGYDHAKLPTGEIFDELPYYGEVLPESVMPAKNGSEEERQHGRINNPTVHIGLNRIRILINNIIAEYGHPEEIHIEVAREIGLGAKALGKLVSDQIKNEKENEKIKKELTKLGINNPSREDLQKYKLWQELPTGALGERVCIYTGKTIGISELFSSEVEIEHILPRAATLDDGLANKTISYRQANAFKGKRSPYEAFSCSNSPWSYNDILERVKEFPQRKQWRFNANAMEKFKDEVGFLERQLNDTKYLSRIAKKYLSYVCNPYKIYCVRGKITSKIRGQLGLNHILSESDQNKKNRDDHRHHAVDALVIGLTNQKMIKELSKAYSINDKIKGLEEPWQNFMSDARSAIKDVVVFHRPDHGIGGELHKETSYEILKNKIGSYNVAIRNSLLEIKESEIDKIKDEKIKNDLKLLKSQTKERSFQEILSEYSITNNIKKIKIMESKNPIVRISHPKHRKTHHRDVQSNGYHHITFWKIQNGTNIHKLQSYCDRIGMHLWIDKNSQYILTCINYFLVNKYKKDKNALKPCPNAKLIMRLSGGDSVMFKHKNNTIVGKIRALGVSANRVNILVNHDTGGDDVQKNEVRVGFGNFKESQLRNIYVTPLGNIKDTNRWYEEQ